MLADQKLDISIAFKNQKVSKQAKPKRCTHQCSSQSEPSAAPTAAPSPQPSAAHSPEHSVANFLRNTICQDVDVTAESICQGTVDDSQVDNDSTDPDGDDLTLEPSPTGSHVDDYAATLTSDDGTGGGDQCTATPTVIDVTPQIPQVLCKSPATISPPDSSPNHCFSASTVNNCGSMVNVAGFDCFKVLNDGKSRCADPSMTSHRNINLPSYSTLCCDFVSGKCSYE